MTVETESQRIRRLCQEGIMQATGCHETVAYALMTHCFAAALQLLHLPVDRLREPKGDLTTLD